MGPVASHAGVAWRGPSSSCLYPAWLLAQPVVPCGKEASLADPSSQGGADGLQARGWARSAGQDECAQRETVWPATVCRVPHGPLHLQSGPSVWQPWEPHFQEPGPVSSQHKPPRPLQARVSSTDAPVGPEAFLLFWAQAHGTGPPGAPTSPRRDREPFGSPGSPQLRGSPGRSSARSSHGTS